MSKLKIIPIILCGGKGTRLWPLSRESYPKQFLSLYGENNKSLLVQTYERISELENIDDPILICNEEHRFLVAEQMRGIGIKPKAIILEKEGKNTAPAIALGALKVLQEEKEDSLLLVLSSDHIINNLDIYQKVLRKGFEYGEKGHIVTFGIVPHYPETGYGYIESSHNIEDGDIKVSKIKTFLEKPNEKLAIEFIKSNNFTWNSGMFVFKTSLILKEFDNHAPLVIKKCKESISKSINDLDFIRIEEKSFNKVPNISFDIAIMEKTNRGLVISLDAGWSDLGSWKSLWDSEDKDEFGNFSKGKVINLKSKNCYLRSESRLLVGVGLDNLIVVETSDAILVAEKKYSENLKSIVNNLKDKGYKESIMHKKIYRPWGYYISLVEDKRWQVKRIEVNPGSTLSLQMHKHRAEHWTVVKGIAEVQIENKVFQLSENQSTYIPLGSKHRLSNPGEISLTLIEVQSGDYIGEDDIIRFEDLYGRNSDNK